MGDVPGLEVRDSFIELDDAGLDVADELGSLFFLGRLGSFGRPRFFAGLKKTFFIHDNEACSVVAVKQE